MDGKWIGLFSVRPQKGNNVLGDAIGALVAAIALAEDPADFSRKVSMVLASEGFDVVQIEDVDLVDNRVRQHSVAPNVAKLASEVTQSNPVVLGDFHSYKS
jgi:hypothetical protein